MSDPKTPLVDVRHLKEYFRVNVNAFQSRDLKAVDDVSFQIRKGETLGLVGESGCGKTTVGRTILQLYKPTAGEIWYDGKQVVTKEDLNEFRKKATMVFQDPYSSLNPRMTVSDIIGEPLDVHKLYSSKEERHDRILELMGYVGLNSEHAARYAHEFSGGQRQRIGIARALAVSPEFIVCDEPVSALDVSIQAQVINMFDELQDRLGLTYLFIAHDLLVVRHISDRIAVMYLGQAGPDLSVHRPRSAGGTAHFRPHRRHVSGTYRGTGGRRGDLQSSSAPLLPFPAVRGAGAGSQYRPRQQAHRAGRGYPQPAERSQRMSLPYPLPLRRRLLR